MIRITLLSSLIVTGLVAAPMAQAKGGPGFGGPRAFGGTPPSFTELDLNGDGLVTQDEMTTRFENARAERFASSDSDGDGVLSRAEMLAAAESRASERREAGIDRLIARLDTDGDGGISQQEMTAARGKARSGGDGKSSRFFTRMDTDGSGALSVSEYEAALERMAQMRKSGQRAKQGQTDGTAPDAN